MGLQPRPGPPTIAIIDEGALCYRRVGCPTVAYIMAVIVTVIDFVRPA